MRGAKLIVAMPVLATGLLSIVAVIVSFIPQQRGFALDESGIDTAARLDAAMAIQRSKRIRELQRRMTDRNLWPYALLGLAFLMQMAALAVDTISRIRRLPS
jgi:hypothetical protein